MNIADDPKTSPKGSCVKGLATNWKVVAPSGCEAGKELWGLDPFLRLHASWLPGCEQLCLTLHTRLSGALPHHRPKATRPDEPGPTLGANINVLPHKLLTSEFLFPW